MLATLLSAAPRYGGPSTTRGADAPSSRAVEGQRRGAAVEYPVEYVVEGDVLRRESPNGASTASRWDRLAVEQRAYREDSTSPYAARRAIHAYQTAPLRHRSAAQNIDLYA